MSPSGAHPDPQKLQRLLKNALAYYSNFDKQNSLARMDKNINYNQPFKSFSLKLTR
jgi:hypothetical protein